MDRDSSIWPVKILCTVSMGNLGPWRNKGECETINSCGSLILHFLNLPSLRECVVYSISLVF